MGAMFAMADEEADSTSSTTVRNSPEQGGASGSVNLSSAAGSLGRPSPPAGQGGVGSVSLSSPPSSSRKPLCEVMGDVSAELLQFSQEALQAAMEFTAPEKRRQVGAKIILETAATVRSIAPEPFVEGAAVSIWSNTTKSWFDDGIVEEAGQDRVKVIYDSFRVVQVLDMEDVQSILKLRDEVPLPNVAGVAISATADRLLALPAPPIAGHVQASPPRRPPATLTRDSPGTRSRDSPALMSGRALGQGPSLDSTGATMSPREVSSLVSPDRHHHGESEPRDVQHEVLECMQVAGSLAVSLSRGRPDLRQMQRDAIECKQRLGDLTADQQCFAKLLEHVEQLLSSTEETAFGVGAASGSTNSGTGASPGNVAARSNSAAAQSVIDFVAGGRSAVGPTLARSATPRSQQRSETASFIQPSPAPPSPARAPGSARVLTPREPIAQAPVSARATWPPKRGMPGPGSGVVSGQGQPCGGGQLPPAVGPHPVYMPSSQVLARSQTMSYTSFASAPTPTGSWQRPIVAATSASIIAATSAKDGVHNTRLGIPTEPLAVPSSQHAVPTVTRTSSSRSPGPGPRPAVPPIVGPTSSWGLVTPPVPWPPLTTVLGPSRELGTARTYSPPEDRTRSQSPPPVVSAASLSAPTGPRLHAIPPISRMADLQASVALEHRLGAFAPWHPEFAPPSGPSEPVSARSSGGCSARAPNAQSSPLLGHGVKRLQSAPSPPHSPWHAVSFIAATPSPRRGRAIVSSGCVSSTAAIASARDRRDPADVSPSDRRCRSAGGADAATQTLTPPASGHGPALE